MANVVETLAELEGPEYIESIKEARREIELGQTLSLEELRRELVRAQDGICTLPPRPPTGAARGVPPWRNREDRGYLKPLSSPRVHMSYPPSNVLGHFH